jgi:hypothetical protein
VSSLPAPAILASLRLRNGLRRVGRLWSGIGLSAFFDRIKFVFITILITTLPYASLDKHLLLQSEISDRRGLNALLTSFLVLQASNTIPVIQQQRWGWLRISPTCHRLIHDPWSSVQNVGCVGAQHRLSNPGALRRMLTFHEIKSGFYGSSEFYWSQIALGALVYAPITCTVVRRPWRRT